MYVPANWEFVLRGELPALDTDAAAYVFPQGTEPSNEQLNSLLGAFGMEGSFTRTTTDAGTDYEWTTWSVGPNDGSGSSITVSDDGLLSWWYSEGWQETTVGRPAPCADTEVADSTDSSTGSSAGSPSTDTSSASTSDTSIVAPDESCMEWIEPTPPENVPSASEAETQFRDLFARLGFGSDQMIVESYGDDWSAGAWAYVMVDGVRSSLTLSASFGENGRVTYASGYLGRADVLASYPRIGTTAGLDRLRDEYGAMMAPAVGLPKIEEGAAIESDPAVSEPVTTDQVVSDTVAPDSVPGDSIPVETVPEETIAPETITVDIVGVEEEYILYWSVDGEVYLVPGYTFIAAEDEWGYRGRYTVPAIPSEYLDVVQPPVMAEPMPAEPEPALPGESDVIGIAPEDAERLVGMSEADAVTEAEAQGWDVRVVARDGEEFPITMDYSTARVNLTVENDVVTKVYVG